MHSIVDYYIVESELIYSFAQYLIDKFRSIVNYSVHVNIQKHISI